MISDSLEKTVHIPVIIINGEIRYSYGGNLPKIKNGAEGKLIVREYDTEDKEFIKISQHEEKIEILPKDTELMLAINPFYVPEEKRQYLNFIKTIDNKSFLHVRVVLLQSLFLQLRGSKMSNLMMASCKIPGLNRTASSINNAYTIVSQELEPERKSHTGNVFEKCYYKDDDDQLWHPLNYLRIREENIYEEKLFLDNKLFNLVPEVIDSICNNRFDREIFSDNELIIIDNLIKNKYITGFMIKKIFNDNKKNYINAVNCLLDRKVIFERK
jgi:hypothetical protein